MNDRPRIPVGSSAKLNLDRRNHDAIYNRGRAVQSTSARIQQNARGFRVNVIPRSPYRVPPLQKFVLTAINADYLTCRDLDIPESGPWIVGDTDIFIAKDPLLRNSITTETIDGTEFSYTYTTTGARAFVARVSHDESETLDDETQVVIPWWVKRGAGENPAVKGNIILAMEVFAGTGVWRTWTDEEEIEHTEELSLVEISSRAWAKEA